MIIELSTKALGDIQWALGAAHGNLYYDIKNGTLQHDLLEQDVRRLVRNLQELSALFQSLYQQSNLKDLESQEALKRMIQHEIKPKAV